MKQQIEPLEYTISVEGKSILVDQLGYLFDPSDWSDAVAKHIALNEDVELQQDHWVMIKFVRDWFEDRHSVPETRWLLKAMKAKLGEIKATRRYLNKLFSHGYGPELCKIVGMRMPRKVMLDV